MVFPSRKQKHVRDQRGNTKEPSLLFPRLFDVVVVVVDLYTRVLRCIEVKNTYKDDETRQYALPDTMRCDHFFFSFVH